MNRQTKRQMAKSGTDKPRAQDRKAVTQTKDRERISPGEFFSEVRGEMRKVAWPTRPEVINSTLVVIVAVIFLGGVVFAFDYGAAKFVLFLFG
ncbi:MAG TPA: preprotein translocase subunit SecE [Acidimicrobiia bacterium]|nr:preprotein translocase subunit SecE [Acidimicrobiia bacterium]